MSARVYVGRLSHRARERDVERAFRAYGRIREIVMKNGYGFVEFEDHRDADDAVYELNNKDICGERILVEHAKGSGGGYRGGGGGGGFGGGDRRRGYSDYRGGGASSRTPSWMEKYGPPTRTNYRLTVENLSSRVSWQLFLTLRWADLKDYMRQAGDVTYADAHKHRKHEGTVEFATYADMKTALEKLDDTEINGRRIRLEEEKRRGGGGRGRSHSRSHSRSRSRSRSPRRRSRSRSRSRSKGDRRSRSRSVSKGRGGSGAGNGAEKSRSRSPSRGRSDREDDRGDRKRDDDRADRRRDSDRGKDGDRDSRSRSPSHRSSRSRSRSGRRSDSRSRSRSMGDRDSGQE